MRHMNVEAKPAPTSAIKKADMQKWLNEREIFFEEKETKPELHEKKLKFINHNIQFIFSKV